MFLINQLLVTVCCAIVLFSEHSSHAEEKREHNFIWNYWFGSPQRVNDQNVTTIQKTNICVGCGSKLYDDIELEKEITALRIEYIKNQILKKLRLTEKPIVTQPITGLPKPVTEDENLFPRSQDSMGNGDNDDYYGKIKQAIIFPHDEDEVRCTAKKRNPSSCLNFEIPTDLHPADVSMAELWVYKNADILDNHNQTFLVSEVAHWDSKRSFQKLKPIAMKETDIGEGWIKINIAWAIKNWFEYGETSHVLNVACKTCGMDVNLAPISLKQDFKPFLVIYTYPQTRKRTPKRIKRNLNCVPGVNECCRENLYVSFKEIGWDDWILYPPGYNAYFCRGSCSAAASITLSGSYHNTIIRQLPYYQKIALVPCCAPTQYNDLELFLNDNKTITKKLLPNMIVDTCGCM